MTDTMPDFLAKERDRLNGEREVFLTEQKNLTAKIATIDRELHAIDVYEQARIGKPTVPRSPRGSKKDKVLAILKEGNGLAPKDIGAKLGDAKGLHNLLNSLKKAGKVAVKDGKYTIAG